MIADTFGTSDSARMLQKRDDLPENGLGKLLTQI